jgi:F0F1-type ATP synthase assembly protein I
VPVRLNPEAAKAWGLALSFGWRVAAGVVIGYWLDNWLDTTPIFISVMSIGALVGAIADMLRISKADSKSDEES